MEKSKEEQKMLDEVVDATAKRVTDTVTPAITEDVLKQLSEKIALRKKELFGEGDGDNGEEKGLSARKKSAEYLKERTKALVSGSSGSGADLVPTFLADQFIGIAQNYGIVRRRARHWPMEGMKEDIPTLDTVTAYRIDTDGNKVSTSQPNTGTLALASKTVGVIIPVSRKLLNNASIQLVDALSYLAGKALAKLEDTWGINGINAGEGILGNTSIPTATLATGGTTYAKAAAEDLLTVTETMDESFFETADNMSWLMSLGVLNNFRKLRSVVGTDKQGFLFEGFGAPGVPSTMWSIPYDLSPIMPKNSDGTQTSKKFLALVNWDNIIFGDNQQYMLEVSNQATITDTNGSTLINMFEQNMVAIKITGDIDIEIANPTKAHATLTTSAT